VEEVGEEEEEEEEEEDVVVAVATLGEDSIRCWVLVLYHLYHSHPAVMLHPSCEESKQPSFNSGHASTISVAAFRCTERLP